MTSPISLRDGSTAGDARLNRLIQFDARSLASRVAARHIIYVEAQRVVSLPVPRVAREVQGSDRVRRELTASVLAAFGEAVMDQPLRVVYAGIGRRMEQLWKLFQSVPKAWEDFKEMLGVRATSTVGLLRELPGKIQALMRDGKKYLADIGQTLAHKIPVLGLYLDLGSKLPSLGDTLAKAMDYLPDNVQRALRSIGTRANSLAAWVDDLLDEYHVIKPIGKVVSAAVFAIIWFNVVEISWDIPEIVRGFLGGYSFVELIQSLPESGAGFVLGLLFPGIPGGLLWNVLLPITVALRIAWMIRHDLASWRPGGKLVIQWDRMGVDPATLR